MNYEQKSLKFIEKNLETEKEELKTMLVEHTNIVDNLDYYTTGRGLWEILDKNLHIECKIEKITTLEELYIKTKHEQYLRTKGILEKFYGEGFQIRVNKITRTCTGDFVKTYTRLCGLIYGNDECFGIQHFYQYVLTEDGELYQCFYNVDGVESLDEVNLARPLYCDLVDHNDFF